MNKYIRCCVMTEVHVYVLYVIYVLDINVKCEPKVSDNCLKLMVKTMSFNKTSTVSVNKERFRVQFF